MPSFRCPKCSALINGEPDAQGIVTCGQCHVRLRARPTAPAPAAPPPPAPTVAQAPASAPPPRPAAPVPARPAVAPPAAAAPSGPAVDAILAELKAIRALQQQILGRLESRRAEPPSEPPPVTFNLGDDDDAPRPKPVPRNRRRKTVLLIDDDPATTDAAVTALGQADVPVRTVDDGNAALAAIAAEKPDVIAIELEMGGAMAGKDVINMIKATMEWVDIPIVLYTRAAVASQKEARTIHGADELVPKATEGPAGLVARVIALFRRG